MIPTLLRIAFTSLRRDRVVQAMTFLLPIIFFSIFAGIFGSQSRDVTAKLRVAIVGDSLAAGLGYFAERVFLPRLVEQADGVLTGAKNTLESHWRRKKEM